MKVRNLLVLNSLISLISAIGLLVMPKQYVAPFDVTLDPAGLMFARMMGSQLLGLAIFCWLGRNLGVSGRRVLVLGSIASWVVFTTVITMAMNSSVTNSTAMLWVVIGIVMSLGMIGAATGVVVKEESSS